VDVLGRRLAAGELAGVSAGDDVAVPARLDHATIAASDFARSLAFYDAALGALGLVRVAEFGDEEEEAAELEAAGWGPAGGSPLLWVVNGRAATAGAHVALRAGSRAAVEAFYAAAVAAGGVPHDAPRRWAIFRRGDFNAVVADPDGNLVEAVSGE
jgi:catechol 2,3-dioxygenase-like lactoylglutathione lyase family enzyme